MLVMSEKHDVDSKLERRDSRTVDTRSSQEADFLEIKEFDQETRKRVKNRVY